MFGKVMLYVGIGMIAMLLPMTLVAARRRIKLWKSIPIALYATLVGTISTYFWFFLENQYFGGISFFGAVFLCPVFFLLATKLFHEDYYDLIDMFAPGICMMLSVMKVQCYSTGCCGGKELFVNADGITVYFPSQLVELGNALLIMAVLLVLAFYNRFNKKLYPFFILIYGCTRFVLNFFRKEWVNDSGLLPPLGTIWSVLAIVIGAAWLMFLHRAERVKQPYHVET